VRGGRFGPTQLYARSRPPSQRNLAELTTLREQLKTGLSASSRASNSKPGPSVSELAQRIKALKAASRIEGKPLRARQKHSSAEEPITSRIRRRAEAAPVSELSKGSRRRAQGDDSPAAGVAGQFSSGNTSTTL
jgi:hypothetical protein